MIGGSAWARIDSTLWNLAFTGQAKASYVFLWHTLLLIVIGLQQQLLGQVVGEMCSLLLLWLQVCSFCAKDSRVSDRNHKAMFCFRAISLVKGGLLLGLGHQFLVTTFISSAGCSTYLTLSNILI